MTIVFSVQQLFKVCSNCLSIELLFVGIVFENTSWFGKAVIIITMNGMWVTAFNINNWNVGVGDNFGRHGFVYGIWNGRDRDWTGSRI